MATDRTGMEGRLGGMMSGEREMFGHPETMQIQNKQVKNRNWEVYLEIGHQNHVAVSVCVWT